MKKIIIIKIKKYLTKYNNRKSSLIKKSYNEESFINKNQKKLRINNSMEKIYNNKNNIIINLISNKNIINIQTEQEVFLPHMYFKLYCKFKLYSKMDK